MYTQPPKSYLRGASVNTIGASTQVHSVAGETVQLYYSNSGVFTIDAGQPAGTAVAGKTAASKILNNLNDTIAVFGDRSLVFTSTALTSEVKVDPTVFDGLDGLTFAQRLAYMTLPQNKILTTNGQYAVDYDRGVIYGIKADAGVSLTVVSYKVPKAVV